MKGFRFTIKSCRLETRKNTFTNKYLMCDIVKVRPNSPGRYNDPASFEICQLVFLGSFILPNQVDTKNISFYFSVKVVFVYLIQ